MEEGKLPRAQVQALRIGIAILPEQPQRAKQETKAKTTQNNTEQEATSCALLITECNQVYCKYK